MKAVIQRVKKASVEIEGKIYSKINRGLLILFCAEKNDVKENIDFIANKILNLRIFEDENHKMNLSVKDITGEILIVSQFTLASDLKKGLRPSFDNAMEPIKAKEFYEDMILKLKESKLNVQTGVFGADMQVMLINDGPVTFVLNK
ncbi:TPA: D-tyrosyl-tRNA(Tyr) deacylase [Candidatus Galligastranaerophilus gallistercoris]|nr:D-tyrosyl-tRNA(Tyr) deacylase [Candidatus Galligastranaerophilus gallistercoris]